MGKRSLIAVALNGALFLTGCSGERSTGAQPAPGPGPQPVQTDQWQVVQDGRTVREWYDRARDPLLIKTERELAFQELAKAGQAGRMALFELLQASDADTVIPYDPRVWRPNSVQAGFVRWKAAEAFGGLGRAGQQAAPQLAEIMLRDPVTDVRAVASGALARIGSRDPDVIGKLKEALRGNDIWVWQGAVYALANAPPLDPESVELLNRIGNADPYKIGRNDSEWAAVMNARQAAREALWKR
jgi:hypothetical protein